MKVFSPICTLLYAWLLGAPSTTAQTPLPQRAPRSPSPARAFEPIYVVFSYHLDPLGANAQVAQVNYPNHRDALQWATALSLSSGVKLSAGCTGPYAEACVINGHEADFQTFMPGGHNSLGVHLHAQRKLASHVDYQWQTLGTSSLPPLIVAEVFADQVLFVNQIFSGLGVAATDNDYLHGSHVQISAPGLLDQVFLGGGIAPHVYPNTFPLGSAARGLYHPFHHSGDGQSEDPAGPYVGVPITSGIAGEDANHGPEGFVYGTLRYIQKDFLLEYLEWRFAQSHGLLGRIWTFGWGSHPFQTTSTSLGTDGLPIRQTLVDLIAWLNGAFVERPSAEGNVIARYATFGEVQDRFLRWEGLHPGTSSIDGSQSNGPNHQLGATAALLANSYYDGVLSLHPFVETHSFVDHNDGRIRYVVWSDSPPQTLDLSSVLPGGIRVTDHSGSVSAPPSATIPVGGDPLVVTAQ